MFNLEQAISEWRRQMLAAGIRAPVPLDELEIHLREDVEQQMQSGINAQQAFEIAVAGIGQADALKTEFAKAGSFLDFLGVSKSAKTNRVLGVLWLAGCSWSFNTICHQHPMVSRDRPVLVMSMNALFIYAAGVVGSVFLFLGATWGRSIVRMLALLMAIACFAQLLSFSMAAKWREWCGVVTVFSLVTIWLLHAPADKKPGTAAQ
jgi:hypothetical protein